MDAVDKLRARRQDHGGQNHQKVADSLIIRYPPARRHNGRRGNVGLLIPGLVLAGHHGPRRICSRTASRSWRQLLSEGISRSIDCRDQAADQSGDAAVARDVARRAAGRLVNRLGDADRRELRRARKSRSTTRRAASLDRCGSCIDVGSHTAATLILLFSVIVPFAKDAAGLLGGVDRDDAAAAANAEAGRNHRQVVDGRRLRGGAVHHVSRGAGHPDTARRHFVGASLPSPRRSGPDSTGSRHTVWCRWRSSSVTASVYR